VFVCVRVDCTLYALADTVPFFFSSNKASFFFFTIRLSFFFLGKWFITAFLSFSFLSFKVETDLCVTVMEQ
jgi:hypothetical protein